MKKWKDIYNERLLLFATHLNKLEVKRKPILIQGFVEWVSKYSRTFSVIDYNPIFFNILPEIFTEWRYYKDEEWIEPEYKLIDHLESLGALRGCINFFGLEPEELVHLFDLGGFQNTERFGGTQLDKNSTPQEVANNIFEFVNRRENFATYMID
ncbi:MAG: hypothetical protein J0L69_12945 [Bacteroidetes bacterium]|nr:hypothetical protein [Bacteroidota bacterium]